MRFEGGGYDSSQSARPNHESCAAVPASSDGRPAPSSCYGLPDEQPWLLCACSLRDRPPLSLGRSLRRFSDNIPPYKPQPPLSLSAPASIAASPSFIMRRRCRRLPLLLLLLCFIFFPASAAADSSSQPLLDAAEQAAVREILAGVNPEVDWTGDTLAGDLCTSGPHGIVCDVDSEDPTSAHVTELNVGYVSEYSNNPSCSPSNASFSPAISRLPHLSKLFFYRCFVGAPTTLPSYIWSLGPQLRELVLHSNPALHGSLPTDLSHLAGLRRLVISGTSISGGVPSHVGVLRRLRQLDLSRNALTGRIPPTIGRLEELMILDFSSNMLAGDIPTETGDLVNLLKLDFSDNNLTGEIPTSLASLHSLELLDLSRNNFSGRFPPFIPKLVRLKALHLSHNPIIEPLPDSWNNLQQLVGLDLSSMGLMGSIPPSMGELRRLSYLALDHNHLLGAIPFRLAELPCINHLDLSHNSLAGLVPFSKPLVLRLGHRLRLVGNDELCVGSDVVDLLSERMAIARCGSASPSSAMDIASQSQLIASDGCLFCWTSQATAIFSVVVFFLC